MILLTETLRRPALAARQSRREDWLAIVVLLGFFFAALFVVECIAITLLDWLEGRPHSVIPALMAFLEVLDGGAR
ncbi:MAG TPA: hypothetical protein VGE10_10995 [Zeimonas sp.]